MDGAYERKGQIGVAPCMTPIEPGKLVAGFITPFGPLLLCWTCAEKLVSAAEGCPCPIPGCNEAASVLDGVLLVRSPLPTRCGTDPRGKPLVNPINN
jgi:hypothetical protein